MTRILLKARPLVRQLADRLAEPVPEGIELYLDRLDLTDRDWLGRIRAAIDGAGASEGFVWIVEAPIRTLAGAYFDLSANDPDHRETIRRVLEVGTAIGAVAANVHAVAPTIDARLLESEHRRRKLDQARPLLDYFVTSCQDRGLVPQVENIPPVGRMREGSFVFSPIGAAPADLLALVAVQPSLRLTVDVSHAALYLNWRGALESDVEPDLWPVARFSREVPGPADLRSYVTALATVTTTVHVSNAAGLLGEGKGYGDGNEDLDDCLRPLVGNVPYFVTETLESDPEHATGMREAQTRLLALRGSRLARSE